MIEVEKKFKLNDEEEKRLLKGAEFVSEKTFTDVYYDTADFTLSKNNIWLRERDGEFQLKLPVFQKEKMQTTQFQEIEGEDKIREIFAVATVLDFETDIKAFGYEFFCQLRTTRKKYQKEGFEIDLDEAVSILPGEEDFVYKITEIELLVENKDEVSSASKQIEKFAKRNELKFEKKRGKIVQYLFQKKPKHFEALVVAGVVKAED